MARGKGKKNKKGASKTTKFFSCGDVAESPTTSTPTPRPRRDFQLQGSGINNTCSNCQEPRLHSSTSGRPPAVGDGIGNKKATDPNNLQFNMFKNTNPVRETRYPLINRKKSFEMNDTEAKRIMRDHLMDLKRKVSLNTNKTSKKWSVSKNRRIVGSATLIRLMDSDKYEMIYSNHQNKTTTVSTPISIEDFRTLGAQETKKLIEGSAANTISYFGYTKNHMPKGNAIISIQISDDEEEEDGCEESESEVIEMIKGFELFDEGFGHDSYVEASESSESSSPLSTPSSNRLSDSENEDGLSSYEDRCSEYAEEEEEIIDDMVNDLLEGWKARAQGIVLPPKTPNNVTYFQSRSSYLKAVKLTNEVYLLNNGFKDSETYNRGRGRWYKQALYAKREITRKMMIMERLLILLKTDIERFKGTRINECDLMHLYLEPLSSSSPDFEESDKNKSRAETLQKHVCMIGTFKNKTIELLKQAKSYITHLKWIERVELMAEIKLLIGWESEAFGMLHTLILEVEEYKKSPYNDWRNCNFHRAGREVLETIFKIVRGSFKEHQPKFSLHDMCDSCQDDSDKTNASLLNLADSFHILVKGFYQNHTQVLKSFESQDAIMQIQQVAQSHGFFITVSLEEAFVALWPAELTISIEDYHHMEARIYDASKSEQGALCIKIDRCGTDWGDVGNNLPLPLPVVGSLAHFFHNFEDWGEMYLFF